MSNMILRPKHGMWVLYSSDRPSQKEFFDSEQVARKFAAKHYKSVEVIVPPARNRAPASSRGAPRRSQENTGLTLGYFFAQAVASRWRDNLIFDTDTP